MTYAPKNSEVTLYCTEQLYSSSDYCMDVLPIFAFTDYPSAVRATLTITVQLEEASSVFLYPLEATITDEGYLKFDFVGGVDRRVAIGKRVLVGEKLIPGIIGIKAYHLVSREEEKKVPYKNLQKTTKIENIYRKKKEFTIWYRILK